MVKAADRINRVPVLVAYNLPFRDCAPSTQPAAQPALLVQAWIDGFAAGIGDREAVVILEPDGLGIIPWYATSTAHSSGASLRRGQPATAAAERYEQLNYAVDALSANPGTSVYLDGTHSAWLNVGEITDRLLDGVERCRLLPQRVQLPVRRQRGAVRHRLLVHHLRDRRRAGRLRQLRQPVLERQPGEQLDRGRAEQLRRVERHRGRPGAEHGRDQLRYDLVLAGAEPSTHFVIDTSRNGVGPWQPPAGVYSNPEDWCNPPDRGLGLRPTASTTHCSTHTCGSRCPASRTVAASVAPADRSTPSAARSTRQRASGSRASPRADRVLDCRGCSDGSGAQPAEVVVGPGEVVTQHRLERLVGKYLSNSTPLASCRSMMMSSARLSRTILYWLRLSDTSPRHQHVVVIALEPHKQLRLRGTR